MAKHYRVVIVGGGTGGLTVAAQLRNEPAIDGIAVIEPSEKHYYQPLWTLVGGGVFKREVTERNEGDFIPHGVDWIRDAVTVFEPNHNQLQTKGGETITYDWLVVAAGIQLNWSAVKGLKDAIGHDGVCSNYSFETVDSTWETIRNFKGGNAVFTHPNTPIKCGGAPQKIMYLAEEYFRKHGVRDKSEVMFMSANASIFSVGKYAATLNRIIAERGIKPTFNVNLVEVKPASKEAVFEDLQNGNHRVVKYEMLHVTPPMGPPDFIKHSPLASEAGWVDVDKYTLQHTRHNNVFALGDSSNLPTSKSGAAIRKQAPTVSSNLRSAMAGEPLEARYDGYTSCPLVTGYGKLVLAEFDYDGNPKETFPFDQSQERFSMYAMKAYMLPDMYWHGMLRGRM